MGRKILNISLPEELYAAVDDLAAKRIKAKRNWPGKFFANILPNASAGDHKHLLPLKRYPETVIVDSAEFLEIYENTKSF